MSRARLRDNLTSGKLSLKQCWILSDGVGVTDDGKMPPLVGKVVCNDKIEHVNFNTNVVAQAMKKLKNNLSGGPDGLPPLLFKKRRDGLAHPLSIIYTHSCCQFQQSLQNGSKLQ